MTLRIQLSFKLAGDEIVVNVFGTVGIPYNQACWAGTFKCSLLNNLPIRNDFGVKSLSEYKRALHTVYGLCGISLAYIISLTHHVF